ncbi:sigma-70 family RNA polymerase sigma factor [Micromonospora sp. WMMD1102]|uniref:RNA polymerase sigma factor n=1 Tax=Micromonospora sp. WMMD1102 TaxID=3016105 RepID=UPI0024151812|nr:sigma-70 family RNA polymerase sigma factor [Micromonospora sp. WMMD1102]MDG4789225.1 sigma-70 family RNA polymerase sigma factor [Micromonospora sp. WMMD1102]
MRSGDNAVVRAESAARLGDRGQAESATSFEVFCQCNFVLVERFLLARCADRGLVEDAVQEAFATARDKWEQIRDYEKPLAWLYKTARYKLLVLQRRHGPEPTVSLAEVPPERLAEPADPAEARELLRGWLRQLPPRQAEVFVLTLDGWQDHEIAAILGIAHNTVRAYRQEARRRLRELAQQAGFETPAGRDRG